MAGGHLVLVGAGHAHLHTLKRTGDLVGRGHRVTLIAPGSFWYSGLATGMLGGLYAPERDQVDVAALARMGGGDFVEDSLAALDPAAKIVRLASGREIGFDALSLNLGSEPPPIPGAEAANYYSVKPIPRLRDLRRDLESAFAAGRAPRVLIAGSGVTGCELAANLAALAQRSRGTIRIEVISAGEPLATLPAGARRQVVASLAARGIVFRAGARVDAVADSEAILHDGNRIAFDAFLNAAGLRPNPVLGSAGLPLDPYGALHVDRFLRVPGHETIHSAGDCIALEGHELPRIGVYAIRQAPILCANLRAALEGGEPQQFEPQQDFLWIMNLGDGTGLAVRGRRWWHGRLAFRLKDWIDRRFLDEYQEAASRR